MLPEAIDDLPRVRDRIEIVFVILTFITIAKGWHMAY